MHSVAWLDTSSLLLAIFAFLIVYITQKVLLPFGSWCKQSYVKRKALSTFPGPPNGGLFGNYKKIAGEKGLIWLSSWVKKHPKAICLYLSPFHPSVLTYHPDTCKQVMKSTLPKPVNTPSFYSFVKPWFGDGLLLSSGHKWIRNRKLLTPAFHYGVLKPYVKIYNNAVDILLEKILLDSADGKSVDISNRVCLCSLSIILQCAFSSDMKVQETENPLLFPSIIYDNTTSGKEFKQHLKVLLDLSHDVVDRRRRDLKTKSGNSASKYPDFLDILLMARDEDGKGLTDAEINDEVNTFLFAGHDTTASAISWILHTLAKHPHHQEKCYQEIAGIVAGRDSQDIQWSDLDQLPYLSMCIKEGMRLHSPIPHIARVADREFELEGHTIPVGARVTIHVHQLHHNTAVWGDDHDVFKPERFDDENSFKMDDYQFCPFSAGQRNCIGQKFAMHEIKVTVAKVIYRFQMTADPAIPAIHLPEAVMRGENGLHVFFKER